MTTRPLDWAMAPAAQTLYRAWAAPCAALHFSTLFLWQQEMQLTALVRPGLFAVRVGWRGADAWCFPCGEDRAVAPFLQALARHPQARLCYLTAAQAARVQTLLPGRFTFARAPADDEYLYDVDRQLALAGKAYRHQRNALHRARALEGVTCHPLDCTTLPLARRLVAAWSRQPRPDAGGVIGADAARRLLDHFDRLQARGVVVCRQGEPAALAAGYPLTEDCFDLALCLQPGPGSELAVLARQQLFAALAGRWRTVNAEEDLGLPGLRALKEGMAPAGRIEMYEGTLHGTLTQHP